MTVVKPFILRHGGKLLVLFLLLQLGGVALSWFGLVPLESILDPPKEEHRSTKPLVSNLSDVRGIAASMTVRPKVERLAIMVVDSMRYDFALSTKSNMPFLTSLVDNNMTFSYISKGRTPTMTLGGIKAFTTGKFSPYTDLLFNLKANELEEDNLITNMYHLGKTMHFYGDETWTDLFPYQFADKEGTEPLYVIDTVEVDRNISRNLPRNLNSTAWDVMILHYLGLDHIGHLTGPKNTLIKPKLREMDDAVRQIYEGVKRLDKIDNKTTLFILCSDHGMSDGGSHVGSTKPELEGLQVYMGTAIEEIRGEEFTGKHIEQVDMASTLAFFLGVPIPKINTGNIIEDVLLRYPPKDVKEALMMNACQMFKAAKDEDIKEHLLTELHDVCLGKGLHVTLDKQAFQIQARKAIATLKDVGIELKKTVINIREKILLSSVFASLLPVLLIFSTLIMYGNDWKLDPKAENSALRVSYMLRKGTFISRYVIAGNIAFYSASLFFSSLVEEEPYIIYFFTATSFISIVFSVAIRMVYYRKTAPAEDAPHTNGTASLLVVTKADGKSRTETKLSNGAIMVLSDDKLIGHAHDEICSSSDDSSSLGDARIKKPVWKHLKDCLIALCIFLAMFAIVHRWNNTGIRWLGQEDIGDYLIQPRNATLLSILVFFANIAMVAVVALYGDVVNTLLFIIGSVFSFGYRSLGDSVLLVASFHVKTENGAWMAQTVFAIFFTMLLRNGVLFILKLCGLKKISLNLCNRKWYLANRAIDMLPISILIIAVLCRVHNIIWFALILTMEFFLTRVIWPRLQRHGFSYTEITILHIWMSKVTFFSQGNSNSLSSIDFSAGFTGIDNYTPAYATSLTVVSLVSGQIFWIVSLIQYIYRSKSYGENKKDVIYKSCYIISCYYAWAFFVLSMSVFAQRYQTTLWDVFVVKLVFSSVDLVLNLIIVIIVLLIANINAFGRTIKQRN